MKITFTPAVFKKFQKMQVVFLLAKNIDNQTHLKESQEMVKDLVTLLRQTFHPDTVKNHHLISSWEVARQGFGSKAKHYHTSLEMLLRKTFQGKNIVTKDAVTNLVNFVALKHFVPLAVDDAKKIKGDLKFDIAESFQNGDIFYADRKEILGTKLDFWKNTKTQPTTHTKEVLIHFEALPPLKNDKIKEITAELGSLLEDFCGGKVKGAMVSKRKQRITL